MPAQAGTHLLTWLMRDTFDPAVYLLAPHRNGTLYTGVTSNLMQRLHRHREGLIAGFTSDYGVQRLVWFEQHATMEHAITREKRIRSEEHTSELQSLMRISYAVFCLKTKKS